MAFRDELYRRYVSSFKAERAASLPDAAFEWWDHKYLPLLDGLDRDAPLLELGCGGGELLSYLQRRGFSHASGIDISSEQVDTAQRRGVNASQADVFDWLEKTPDAYAAIVAVDVLEHFSRDELLRLAPLLHAALEPRGRLLIQTANGAGLFPRQVIYGDLTHLTILTPESLGQVLRPAGFVDLAFYETGPVPIRLRGKLNLALWTGLKAIANTVRRIETGKTQGIWTENFVCTARKA